MIVIGDVHGHFDEYQKLVASFKEPSLQIGDMGVGFPDGDYPIMGDQHRWFRGNHDDPKVARDHSNYLGEGGYIEGDPSFFYVPGAWSIDHRRRIQGVSWWPDEQLSIPDLNRLIGLYSEIKPDIVLSHDAPLSIASLLALDKTLHKPVVPTRTGQALEAMYQTHQPKLWIFGHYHAAWTKQIGRTKFQCLGELQWTKI